LQKGYNAFTSRRRRNMQSSIHSVSIQLKLNGMDIHSKSMWRSAKHICSCSQAISSWCSLTTDYANTSQVE
jgi:hypothetical protein